MNLEGLYARLGYRFTNNDLCRQALAHRSLGKQSNERLEFLGDSILGFIIAAELYRRYPHMPEGDLSRLRAHLVNGEALADIALQLELDQYIQLGQGEEQSGGRKRRSILADAVEAILAAIYLDSHLEQCRQCIMAWFEPYLTDTLSVQQLKDAKSALQEWTQAQKLPLPSYEIVEISGQAHEQSFEVKCCVEGLDLETIGISSSRRRAEQAAAQQFLEKIQHD